MASAKKRPPPAFARRATNNAPPTKASYRANWLRRCSGPWQPGISRTGLPTFRPLPAGPSLGPPRVWGAAGGRGGDLLAAGSNRLQTRFRHLYTGSWASLDRSTAGPGPEDHLDLFMSAGSRGQLAPGPAAVRPACQLAPLLAHWTLPPLELLHPGLPPPPRAHVPPACQLAPLLAQRRPPSCPGHRRARPHAPGPFPPGVPARSAAAATRPSPSRLPTGSLLPPWPVAVGGRPRRPRPRRRFHQVPLDAQLAALPSRSWHQESLVYRSHPPLPPRRCRAR